MTPHGRFEQLAAIAVLAIALVVSVLLVRAAGTSDVEMFLIWGALGQEHGIIDGYKVMVDHWADTVLYGDQSAGGGEYPPLGFVWLYLVSQCADLIGISHLLAFKIGLLAFSFVATGMIGWFSRSVALAAGFQGATVLGAAGLGYMDVVPAPFLIGALWAIRSDRPVLGSCLFLVSVLLKWQPLLIAPFLLLHVLGISGWRSIGSALVKPVTWQLGAVLLVGVLCVATVFGALPLEAFRSALRHPFLSGNTLNVAWLATFLWHLADSPGFTGGEDFSYVVLPPVYLLPFKLVFFLLFAVLVVRFIRAERTFENCLLFTIVGVVTYGVWNSAVHENHWFIALVPAFMLAGHARAPAISWIRILVAVMLNVNLFVFYGMTGQPVVSRAIGADLSLVLAVIFAAIWLLLFCRAWSVTAAGQSALP